MSFTTYYDLEKFSHGTEGWNAAYSTNWDKIDTALNTISGTAGGADADLTTHKSSSDHDGRYYTESEVDALIAAVTVSGISGWADDGVNFRLTFTDGIITAVGTTVSGGYSQS